MSNCFIVAAIDLGKAAEIAADLDSVHPKSPMSQIFRGLRFLESNEIAQVRENPTKLWIVGIAG